MTNYDFDTVIERRGTHCAKHDYLDDDVLAMWVADMDFPSPEPVIEALHKRINHRVFGYSMDLPQLKTTIQQNLSEQYDWEVKPEEIVFLPGVVAAFKAVIRAFGDPGDNVLMQLPVYPPFLSAPAPAGQTVNNSELIRIQEGQRIRYEIDFDDFEAKINDKTKTFLLCSPHNPVGRVWTKEELTRMAEICVKHDVLICSDEIHCDLVFSEKTHIPLAALSPEIAQQTITIMAPSKTYNIPSMGFSFAVIQNEELRKKFMEKGAQVLAHVNVLGMTAALAAYGEGRPWLDAVLAYMQENRDYTTRFIEEHVPGVSITHPEGTYLSWLDCREYVPASNGDGTQWIDPFFMKKARVALNAGSMFGQSGEGFVRLNFGCPRVILTEALERIKTALEQAK
jgi:cysteine-S-conjugate beta-lyase